MMTKQRIVLILIVLPCFLFLSSEEEHHAANPMEFIGKVVNFVVLFGALGVLRNFRWKE